LEKHTMLNFLKSLCQAPQFPTGARVNLLHGSTGIVGSNIDGRVMAQTDQGVLVEWPRSGARWMNPHGLCQQV
jgi:hypothetical protein